MAKAVKVQEPKLNKNRSLAGVVARNLSGWLLILPSLFLFVMIVWRPIVIGISYSFFDLHQYKPVEFIGLKNFKDVLSDTNLIQTFKNTLGYVGWSLLIGFPLPFICAVLMNEMIHAQGYFKVSTYLPVIIPSVAVCMIWSIVYKNGTGGLLNMILYYFGLKPVSWLDNKDLVIPLIVITMSWNGFGSTLIMYLATLQGINQELYEAARLDGAGFFGRIIHVLFPHMRGLLLLMVVRQIIGVFNVTEQPLVMTGGGPNGASLSIGLTNWRYAFQYDLPEKSMALGVCTFCILLCLTFVYFGLDKRVDD